MLPGAHFHRRQNAFRVIINALETDGCRAACSFIRRLPLKPFLCFPWSFATGPGCVSGMEEGQGGGERRRPSRSGGGGLEVETGRRAGPFDVGGSSTEGEEEEELLSVQQLQERLRATLRRSGAVETITVRWAPEGETLPESQAEAVLS